MFGGSWLVVGGRYSISVVGDRKLVVGDWWLVAGGSWSVVVGMLSVVGGTWSVVGGRWQSRSQDFPKLLAYAGWF